MPKSKSKKTTKKKVVPKVEKKVVVKKTVKKTVKKVTKKVVKEVKLPVVSGVQVVKILDSRHTKTHFHCKLANGTTMHVPKSKFK